MTSKPKFHMLQSMTTVDEYSYNNRYYIYLKGWNLPEDFKQGILQEFREHMDDETIELNFLQIEEEAFTCSRYFEGQDAKDEGYSFWVDFCKTWKPGFGKCTCYTISIK